MIGRGVATAYAKTNVCKHLNRTYEMLLRWFLDDKCAKRVQRRNVNRPGSSHRAPMRVKHTIDRK